MKHVCPQCHEDSLLVRAVTSYHFNTGEFFCHSVKTHDHNAPVCCLECDWEGTRADFKDSHE